MIIKVCITVCLVCKVLNIFSRYCYKHFFIHNFHSFKLLNKKSDSKKRLVDNDKIKKKLKFLVLPLYRLKTTFFCWIQIFNSMCNIEIKNLENKISKMQFSVMISFLIFKFTCFFFFKNPIFSWIFLFFMTFLTFW